MKDVMMKDLTPCGRKQEVWDAIDWLRNDPERVLLAVIEEAPAITVLGHNVVT